MTVSTTTAKSGPYAGSGTTGPFTVGFRFLENSHILVVKNVAGVETNLVLDTDYTVTGAGASSGSVTLATALATGQTLTIVRNVPTTQETDYVAGDSFPAESHERALDQLTMIAQQLKEEVDRSAKLPVSSSADADALVADIVLLADISDDISAVAAIDSNVTTVAGIAANVTTVAGIAANVTTVAGIAANVTSVAGNSTNINAVAGNNANITTVAGINTAVTGVYNIRTAVSAVNSNATNINTVSGISSNVTTVAGISANVTTVAGISSAVSTVAADGTDIGAVAAISADVQAVADIAANVTSVAANETSIDTVAAEIGDVITAAANITAIQNASSNATAAAASATAAAASAAAASAVALGNEPVRHSVRPSLLLDFANTKQLDPRITFTRASTATVYDGLTTAKAEENLLLQSADLTTTWTTTRASITANATAAPDGTTTADKLVQDSTAANTHSVQQSATITANSYVFSIYAKKGENTWLSMSTFLSTSVRTFFNLDTGAIGTTAAGHTASIVSVGNGWYRCAVVFTGTAASWSMRCEVAEADNDVTIDGNGTSGIYVWGAQLEQRSTVTAYTPTTTAAITNYIPVLKTAAVGAARFDHNPTTGESLGLLIEESRTNLMTYSEQFDNAAWTKTRASTTSNTIVAPDGTLTGEKLIEDTTASNTHLVLESVSVTSGTSYTFSFYAKSAERQFVQAILSSAGFGSNTGPIVDLSNGTIANAGTGTYTSTITLVGNGWYRIAVTATATATASTQFQIRTCETSSTSIYTGNGYSGIYIWGAQLEAGSFATSYIPTVASQVTRAADAANMNGIGSLVNTAEGTLYCEASMPVASTGQNNYIAFLCDGTSTNGHNIRVSSGSVITGATSASNTTQAAISSGSTSANTMFKAAYSFKTNDMAFSSNAAAASTDTVGDMPVGLSVLRIAQSGSGSITYDTTIRKLALYTKRLTNAELQGLTTV